MRNETGIKVPKKYENRVFSVSYSRIAMGGNPLYHVLLNLGFEGQISECGETFFSREGWLKGAAAVLEFIRSARLISGEE